MNFYWFDLLQLTFVVLSVAGLIKWYKSRNKIMLLPLGLLIISFIFTPINLTEKNQTKRFTTIHEVKQKIDVKETSFEERQNQKFNKLKKQSEEKRNEEISDK